MWTFSHTFVAALAIGAVSAAPRRPRAYEPAEEAVFTPKAKPAAIDPAANAALLQQLSVESTATGRFQKLFVDANGNLLEGQQLVDRTVFDFGSSAKPPPGAKGGSVAAADVSSYPALKELGIATTLAFLGPCGMNTAHLHPRASELLTVVKGEVETGMILQNGILAAGKGTGEIRTHLTQYQATVFPQGSIHYQFNPTCEETVFVAALSAEDPGTNQVAQGFFNLQGDVVDSTLGFPGSLSGRDIEKFRSKIPANLALGVEQCLSKCKIPKN